jgi:hypothetical protein
VNNICILYIHVHTSYCICCTFVYFVCLYDLFHILFVAFTKVGSVECIMGECADACVRICVHVCTCVLSVCPSVCLYH